MSLLIVVLALMVIVASPVWLVSRGDCAEHKQGNSVVSAPVVADTLDKPKGDALRKLGRGLSNCLTFTIEIPNQISKANNSDGPIAALTYGVTKGIVMGIFRAVIGAYEVITFPIPLPEWYRPILTDPEFMLESWSA